MSGLDNLQRITQQATPGKWKVDRDTVEGSYDYPTEYDHSFPWRIKGVCDFADEEASEETAALIAAAPVMAALLQECAEAFGYINGPARLGPNGGMSKANGGSGFPQEIARDLLARLAEFDRSLEAGA